MSHHRLWALQILVISIPVLIFSFIAAQSSAKFTKYQDTIKEFDENESGLANGASSAASYANNAAYQKSNRKYEKAKRKLRHYKNKTVSLISILSSSFSAHISLRPMNDYLS